MEAGFFYNLIFIFVLSLFLKLILQSCSKQGGIVALKGANGASWMEQQELKDSKDRKRGLAVMARTDNCGTTNQSLPETPNDDPKPTVAKIIPRFA